MAGAEDPKISKMKQMKDGAGDDGSGDAMAAPAPRRTNIQKKWRHPNPPLTMECVPKDALSNVTTGQSDDMLQYSPTGEAMPCGCNLEQRCMMGDADCASSGPCEDVTCKNCFLPPSSFNCKCCDRWYCGQCVSNVPCEGPGRDGSGCDLSNCMECAENGCGDVLYCTNCGIGACNDCKPMEFCYCLEGHVCPECHSEMHDYDVECYWRHLPPELQQLVSDFAVEISKGTLSEFWQECTQFLPPDREFDIHLYRRTRKARAATLILASYYLLKGKDNATVYLILYAALLEEVWNRGANYVAQVFGNPLRQPSTKVLSIYFTSFHSVIENTATRANIIALLHNQLSSIRDKEGRKLFECIDFALGKVQKSYALIHSVPVLSAEDYKKELSGQCYGDSLSMNIITSNINNETKQNNFVYKDMTLGWWLKLHVIKCTYHQWLTSPVTSSTKYFRVIHQGRTIFLSSAGKETLHQLGVKDGDEIVFEGVESDEQSTPRCKSKTQDIVTTCTVCNIATCDGGHTFFDCKYCGRLRCGECVLNVPCEGPGRDGSGCKLSNCMECAENGDGDVLSCTNCGRGYCTSCKPMEFCFCLVGDTCPECHTEMHDHDVECYWQHLPSEMKQLVADFAVEISMDRLAEFWEKCSQFLLPDKEFDIQLYRKTRQERSASLILASDHLLKGCDKEAVYLILYAALLEEVWNRGANYIKRIFDGTQTYNNGHEFRILAIYFTSFHSIVGKTTLKADTIAYLHNQLPSIQEKEGKDLLKCLDFALGKVQKSNTPIHSIPILSASDYETQLRGRSDHCNSLSSLGMNLITSNLDNGRKEEKIVYTDMTLGWWLKIYVIKSNYQNWLRNQEIPPSTKYFRVVHQGKTLFLSSAGKKTLQQLQIQDGDEIVVGGVEPEAKTTTQRTKSKKEAKTSKKSKKKNGSGKKKKKSQPPPAQSLTEEQLMEKHRQAHSRTMTPVFEELGPLLKDIRNKLNDLTIKKSAPKKKRPKSARIKNKTETATPPLPAEDSLGGKAGKVAYSILVGDCSNLYNTSKSLPRAPIIIDLHGLSRDEALVILDENLPVWINTAMRGEYPWIIPVDIICGGGSQILSDVVQNWICTNRQVANRPKGFV